MPYNVQLPQSGGGSDYGGQMAQYLVSNALKSGSSPTASTSQPLTPGQTTDFNAGMGPVSAAFAAQPNPLLTNNGYNISPYFQGQPAQKSSSY